MNRFLNWLSAALAIFAVGDAVALFLHPPWWVTSIVVFALFQPVIWLTRPRSPGTREAPRL